MSTNPPAVLPEVEDDRTKVELDEEEQVANEDLATPSPAAQPSSDAASSSAPPFPPEVFLDILNCDLDSADLAACALVCRGLLPLAREVLYSVVYLGFARYWQLDYRPVAAGNSSKKLACLHSNRHLLTYVRELVLNLFRMGPEYDEPGEPAYFDVQHFVTTDLTAELPPLLAGMVNLNEVTCSYNSDSNLEHSILERVRLSSVKTLDIPFYVGNAAASFPSLTALSTRLLSGTAAVRDLPFSVTSPHGLERLFILTFSSDNPSIEDFNWLSSSSYDTLSSLSVSFDFYSPTSASVLPFRPPLHLFTSLHTLELAVLLADDRRRPSHYPSIPPNLGKLSLLYPFSRTNPDLYTYPTTAPFFPSSLTHLSLTPRVLHPSAVLQLVKDGDASPQLVQLELLWWDLASREWSEVGGGVDAEGRPRSAVEVLQELCERRGIRLRMQ